MDGMMLSKCHCDGGGILLEVEMRRWYKVYQQLVWSFSKETIDYWLLNDDDTQRKLAQTPKTPPEQ